MADEARQRHDRPGAPFAVAAPLWTPTRQHVEAPGVRDAARKRANVARRNAEMPSAHSGVFSQCGHNLRPSRSRDTTCACRGKLPAWSPRRSRAQYVCRKSRSTAFFWISSPRNCRHKRRIGSRRDGQPFDVAHDRFGLARVDDDDARALLLLPGVAIARQCLRRRRLRQRGSRRRR